jgi:hypothetical protein
MFLHTVKIIYVGHGFYNVIEKNIYVNLKVNSDNYRLTFQRGFEFFKVLRTGLPIYFILSECLTPMTITLICLPCPDIPSSQWS